MTNEAARNYRIRKLQRQFSESVMAENRAKRRVSNRDYSNDEELRNLLTVIYAEHSTQQRIADRIRLLKRGYIE